MVCRSPRLCRSPSCLPLRFAAALLALALFGVPGSASEGEVEAGSSRPDLVLLTIDTVRADAIGAYGGGAKTPTIDRLAAEGVRYERALTPSPLTLPAHTSLLTGIDPPQHGVRDNGVDALPSDIPTLASILDDLGYDTGAFVSSRVLDGRFGLARGFDVYGDRMTAERIGQYGYPERDAAAVTTAAIDWLESLGNDVGEVTRRAPRFLWVHYYDAHAPYAPPPAFRGDDEHANYLGEIAYVDREIGRLLESTGASDTVIAIVADHGEMLGEHGEEGHGIFLYESALSVPLVLSGPGLPRGKVVDGTVGTVQLASTLLSLLDATPDEIELQPALPGLGDGARLPIFSEALLPASAYGWSPLQALSEDRWRYISAPRPELYDVRADRGETENRFESEPTEATRLSSALQQRIALYGEREGAEVSVDGDLDASLRSLGYLSTSGAEASDIDPKDGIVWLAEREQAKRWLASGEIDRAAQTLRRLVQLNPQNQTFLGQYARALFGLGKKAEGIEVYRRAVALNPKLDFLHVNLAQALLENGQVEEAEGELRLALELNPRSSSATLALAQLLSRQNRPAEERLVLARAAEAGTDSAGVHVRLGQLATRDREFDLAERHLASATELEPRMPIAWLLRAMNSEAARRTEDASAQYARTLEVDPRQGTALFRYGRLLAAGGSTTQAGQLLRRALGSRISPAERAEAEALLRSLGSGG